MLSAALQDRIRRAQRTASVTDGPRPKYGEDIFPTGAPRTFTEFVGQVPAVRHLKATVASARRRGERLDHMLIASGAAGVGKTTLARLMAYEMGVGLVEMSGKLTIDDVRPALLGMADGDILFLDEIHLLVAGGKAAAEGWLLSLMEDGGLQSKAGFEPMPKVTIIAATTEPGRLPKTFHSRFRVRPVLTPYTEDEALTIAGAQARRLGFGSDILPMPEDKVLGIVASASCNAPRAMNQVLVALRDSYLGEDDASFDVDLALSWVGVTRDGLDTVAQDYLIVLTTACNGRASQTTIAGMLAEPGPLTLTEQLLQERGYISIEPTGRQVTEAGVARCTTLLTERGLA